jgi:Sec-independent protein translocase protein TatA
VLAFISNLNFTEMGIVLIGAIMVFGKDLPKVVMRGLQQLAKLRKAVTEMWREAGLEQEFKRVKAELEPEITEFNSARKTLSDGKNLLNGPVSNWRKNIGLELDDVVEVGSTAVDAPEAETSTEMDSERDTGSKEEHDEPMPKSDSPDSSKSEDGGAASDGKPK